VAGWGGSSSPERARLRKLPEGLVEEWEREDAEFRELRRRSADWKFIEEQPPHLRAALLYFIEKGDRYVAARIAGLTVEEFDELRRKANIPVVV